MDLSTLETRFVDVPVTAPSGVNLTSDTVQVAFLTRGKPASGDWKTAAWAINFDDGFTGFNAGASGAWNYFTEAWVKCVR